MLIIPYDTESKSRNVLAPPLGEEGHEVAKGWTVVILIMILDVDVTAEGGYPPSGRRARPPLVAVPPPCPVGSMSLDSRVAGLPYESSSFATPAVRWGGKRKAP